MSKKRTKFREGEQVKVIAPYSSFFGDCGYVWDNWIDNGVRRYTVIVGKFTIYMFHNELSTL